MSTLAKHSAPGQALGYYFQLERALSWIAKSPAFSYVGIETEDDVVVKLASGETIFEQDKSSTTNYPFNPSKKDLWNSLLIWLDAIANEEIDINKVKTSKKRILINVIKPFKNVIELITRYNLINIESNTSY